MPAPNPTPTNTSNFTILSDVKATKLAKQLNRDDPLWTYKVAWHDIGSSSVIEVYDEDGLFLGRL